MSKRYFWSPRSLHVKLNHFYILNIWNWNIDFPRRSAFLSFTLPAPWNRRVITSHLPTLHTSYYLHPGLHLPFQYYIPCSVILNVIRHPFISFSCISCSVYPLFSLCTFSYSCCLFVCCLYIHACVCDMLANLSKGIEQKQRMSGERGEDAKWSVRRFRAREGRETEGTQSSLAYI
jgi:hypothetical protein